MMNKQRLHRVLLGVLMVLVLLIAGVVGAALYFNQGLLSGETSHDFGEMLIQDGDFGVTERHTFELINNTGETVRILAVQPSCGCTEANASRTTIEPGQSVEIETALTLSRSGAKHTYATIIYENEQTQTLHLRGVARRVNPLSTPARALSITREMPVMLTLTLEMADLNASPGTPALKVPDIVEADFKGWRQMRAGSNFEDKPAVWTARYAVRQTGEPLREDAMMTIAMPNVSAKARLEIPLESGGHGMVVGEDGSLQFGAPPIDAPDDVKRDNDENDVPDPSDKAP